MWYSKHYSLVTEMSHQLDQLLLFQREGKCNELGEIYVKGFVLYISLIHFLFINVISCILKVSIIKCTF